MNKNSDRPLVRIGVVGIGGAGGNAVNRMMQEKKKSEKEVFHGVLIMAANTDVQDLERTGADVKIQLGPEKTKGFGAGANPAVGREAAEESKVAIASHLDGLDMLFITAGMGGGTGTGAAPVVGEIAKSAGILTVAVVTTTFNFEGAQRRKIAREGVDQLRRQVDALVIIPNEKLVSIADDDATCDDMFRCSDEVLINAVRSMADVVQNPATHHIDFADVCAVMRGMGEAMIGVGTAAGENRALTAVREALSNPLFSDTSVEGARRALLHFTAPLRFPMKEMVAASQFISDKLRREDPLFIWGIRYEESRDTVQALVISEVTTSGAAATQTARHQSVTADSQSLLFEMAEAKEPRAPARKPAKPEPPAPPPPPVVASPREAAAPASLPAAVVAPAGEAKMRFNDHDAVMTKVDLSERVIFQIPGNVGDADLDDLSVPAVVRQQMRAQRAKEAVKQQEAQKARPVSEAREATPREERAMERVVASAKRVGEKENELP